MLPVLTAPPDLVPAKTTVKWTSTFADFSPADTWAAKVYLSGASAFASGTGVAGTSNGTGFDFVLTPAQTDLKPGTYHYEIHVTKGSEDWIPEDGGSGVLTVLPTRVGAAANSQSFAEKAVEVIETIILAYNTGGSTAVGRLAADVQQFAISGRMAVKIPIKELEELRQKYKMDIWRERNPGKVGPTVSMRFTGS